MRPRSVTFIASCLAIVAIGPALLPASALAQASQYTSIGLEWEAGGDDSTAGRATAYELRYQTSPPTSDTLSWWNGATAAAAGVPSNSGVTDSARVTGLVPGMTYYFVIRAVDDWQNHSAFSNVASATTLDCDEPTVMPDPFTATADTGVVYLAWSGSDPFATSLQIYRGTGSNPLSPYASLNASATSYQDGNVQPGTTYRYRVAYVNFCAPGPSSSTETATLPGLPPVPPSSTGAASIHAYPNPSSGPVQFVFRLEGTVARDARVRLFDMSGHWIATIVERRLNAGEQTITWPRTDRNGHRVTPGYYEAIGTVGDMRVRERIVLTP
jgi:hypothetical protein